MSDDPETVRQIAELARDTRPLVVLDVDEVVLEFLTPFIGFLDHHGHDFRTDSFRLHGNVIDRATGTAAGQETVDAFLEGFFTQQEDWQIVAPGAAEAMGRLGEKAEIVMLTAMPHVHHGRRRALLDRAGIKAPLVTTEKAKGPAVSLLAGERTAPVAFVDDIPYNHVSVAKHFPRAGLFHLMANKSLRPLLPALPDSVTEVADWIEAEAAIIEALSL
ncbi:MAG: hypothetical protein KDJ74_02740 [Notoacmeibacter sp.]|nr:hypothetical protein [Notoacmeibacter sp.]